MSLPRLAASLEALLFVRGNPLTLEELSGLLKTGSTEVEAALSELEKKYSSENSGITVHCSGGRWCLATKPEYDGWISSVLGRSAPLSPAALETLAVIACKEPVTRSEIEQVRGVSADRVLASLMEKGLIEERGRMDIPGKPILYGTTALFLKDTGLSSVEELKTRCMNEITKEESLF